MSIALEYVEGCQDGDRYELIAKYERKMRVWPRSRSTSAFKDKYWPHLDMFGHLRFSAQEVARSRREYEWEQKDKATYTLGFPVYKVRIP